MDASISIFRYFSCDDYLSAFFRHEKSGSKATTLAIFSKALGMSVASLNMILSGKRRVTAETAIRVAKALRLSEAERDYLETMVLSDQCNDDEAKKYYAQKLRRMAKLAKIERLKTQDTAILAHWKLPALLIYLWDVVGLKHGDQLSVEQFENAAKKFKFSPTEIRGFIARFEQSGLLKRHQDGMAHIIFDRVTSSIPHKDYLKQIGNESLNRIDKYFQRADSIFRSFTLSISADEIPELKSDLITLFESYMARRQRGETTNTIVLTSYFAAFPGH